MNVWYDAGLLMLAEAADRRTWMDHRARLEMGVVPQTTAPVLAQVSRSARQVQLRRFLKGCDVEPFAAVDAHAVGALAGSAGTADVVDAHLALVASRSESVVLTSDPHDLRALARALSPRPQVRAV